MINNFSNHLFTEAAQICEENKIPFELLKPLIKETVDKLDDLSPKKAQTGPALREDRKTISAHLSMIENSELKKLYTLLQTASLITIKMKNYKHLLPKIKTFIFDVDGVLTDGKILINSDGELLRSLTPKTVMR